MTIEIFKELASKEKYEYLRDLEYQPCNLPNVGVHYGDVRAICISRESSAYVSEGSVLSYTQQYNNKIVQDDIPITQPTEIRNETKRRIYLILDGCMLLDEKIGDYVVHFKQGIDPDLNTIGSNN